MNHIMTGFLICLIAYAISSCQQEQPAAHTTTAATTEPLKDLLAIPAERGDHKFGGWYCPDNLRGFPPVDVQQMENIVCITDRLPIREETQDCRALMYVDPLEYPEARPFDIDLPRVARTYSREQDGEEVVILIQATIVDSDTIVGYRYPSGGNGSGWYDEVTLLSDAEVAALGSTPYVMVEQVLPASQEAV